MEIVLGVGALYVGFKALGGSFNPNAVSTTGSETQTHYNPPRANASDAVKAAAGQLQTQQAYWTVELPRRQVHGTLPYARRHAVPDRRQTPILIASGMHLSDEYKEYMRALIQDTEPVVIPFSGYRAHYNPELQRRRLPIINHPDSCFATYRIPVPDP